MKRLGLLMMVAALGCSSSSGNGNGGDGGGNNPGADLAGGGGNALVPQSAKLGTYIPLGDSISDRGGTGPYFYDLLLTDLTTRHPGITFEHDAVAGSVTDAYTNGPLFGAPTLKDQITKLGHSYPGDVLISITIGGNDLNGHAVDAIGGTDGPVRAEFGQHLDAELAELATPGRLGSGKVYVVIANIYDFTDGQGDFGKVMCGPMVNVTPMRDSTTFAAWNQVMADSIGKVSGAALFDMHAAFMGHGYNFTDVWYDSASCIHPNAKGHDQIRRGLWKVVTGETL